MNDLDLRERLKEEADWILFGDLNFDSRLKDRVRRRLGLSRQSRSGLSSRLGVGLPGLGRYRWMYGTVAALVVVGALWLRSPGLFRLGNPAGLGPGKQTVGPGKQTVGPGKLTAGSGQQTAGPGQVVGGITGGSLDSSETDVKKTPQADKNKRIQEPYLRNGKATIPVRAEISLLSEDGTVDKGFSVVLQNLIGEPVQLGEAPKLTLLPLAPGQGPVEKVLTQLVGRSLEPGSFLSVDVPWGPAEPGWHWASVSDLSVRWGEGGAIMGAGLQEVFVPYPSDSLLTGEVKEPVVDTHQGIAVSIEGITLSTVTTQVKYRISGVSDIVGFDLLVAREAGIERPRSQSYQSVAGGMEGVAEFNPTTTGTTFLKFFIPEIHFTRDGQLRMVKDGWNLAVPVGR